MTTTFATIRSALLYNISGLVLVSGITLLPSVFSSNVGVVNTPLLLCKLYIIELFLWNGLGFILMNANVKMNNAISGAIVTVLSIVLFHVIAVLYGAPLTESFSETFHLATLLAATTVMPCLTIIGADAAALVRVFAHNKPELGLECCVWITTSSSIVGAWFGAFPIPLDWDRPWQAWPVSCIIGTLLGYGMGLLIASGYILYQYNKIRKMKLV